MRLPAKLRAGRHLRNQTWPFLPVAVRQKRNSARWQGTDIRTRAHFGFFSSFRE